VPTGATATVGTLRTPRQEGMAASDPNTSSDRSISGAVLCLPAAALEERLHEEINRAARHGTPLSCLMVTIGNIDELAREHGEELAEQTLQYVARALGGQVRDFDRIGRPSEVELFVVLPGADGPRGEIVARRALRRLRMVKVESAGERRPLRISVGLVAWQQDTSAGDLLEQARAAARSGYNGESTVAAPSPAPRGPERPHGPA
jgi:diguanylate cyclase (GGDEF)-like protein